MIKILGILYIIVITICFLEAYFYTKLDPKSEKLMKEREKNKKYGNKRNS